MSDGTRIEWTDATWNIVNGCSVVSPGCTNCYAMRLAGTRLKNHPSRAGLTREVNGNPVWTGETRFNDKVLLDPLKWRRPRRIFVCGHGDLFHASVPVEWIDRVFAVMALAPQHQFQLLTKRPDRMRDYCNRYGAHGPAGQAAINLMVDAMSKDAPSALGKRFPATVAELAVPIAPWPLPNVWLGVSVEDQQRADERIPILLDTPAAVRWISAEPLLGPVNLNKISTWHWRGAERLRALTGTLEGMFGDYCPTQLPPIDWVVAGGESGLGARPMHPDWARSLRDQCAAADVPFLFKQWGEWSPDDGNGGLDMFDRRISVPARNWADGAWHDLPKLISERDCGDHDVYRVGKKHGGRLLDGVEYNGFPA